jgi:dihydroxyacetone kinase-like predicted kinase
LKPIDRQVNVLEASRKAKEEDKSIKERFMQDVVHDNPDISREKAVARVNKLVGENKEKNKQEAFYGVTEESFKPEVSATLQKRTEKRFKHDGVYHLSQAVGKEIWSCCGKEEQNAQGCVVTVKNLDKWLTISF